MKCLPTQLDGVFQILPQTIADDRGFFARTWCTELAQSWGLPATEWIQESLSFNTHAGTLRGMHFQRPPHAETKLVQCLKGALIDVVVDLRPHSPTFGQWTAIELNEANLAMVWIPKGCAHGFQTLVDNTLMLYRMDTTYAPEHSGGLAWDDPDLAIAWPQGVSHISERDTQWPTFQALRQTLQEACV